MNEVLKPLRWVGSSLRDLRNLPPPVRRTFGFALDQAQRGGKHPDAKPLKGFGGAGVLEVVESFHRGAYRAVYTVRFSGVVYVLHVFKKKSTQGISTPKRDVSLIKERLTEAERHYRERKLEDL